MLFTCFTSYLMRFLNAFTTITVKKRPKSDDLGLRLFYQTKIIYYLDKPFFQAVPLHQTVLR